MAKLENLIDQDLLAVYHDEVMQTVVPSLEDMATTTYAELKALRDAGKLTPGQYYRITDYVTTTSQQDTQSAGHVFDVIVRADSANTLSETAWAALHDGDTYFQNARLEAWELNYCLDNDTDRFAWADTEDGKGVIYRLKDEFNNDLPYDFKNIQFRRYKVTALANNTSLQDLYAGYRDINTNGSQGTLYPSGGTVSTSDTVWRYTFDFSGQDYSLTPGQYGCHGNVIAPLKLQDTTANRERQWLNNITFGNTAANASCWGNKFKERCNSMSFGNGCYGNTFGQDCYHNTFGQNCESNTFGQSCYSNTFGQSCGSNTFEQYCYSNTFGQSCYSNTFGQSCQDNTFGHDCNSNTFRQDCYRNTFGQSCYRNTFGQSCQGNTFGQSCQDNTFGQSCYRNTFGQSCQGNTFGQSCQDNTFGHDCQYNTLGQYCCHYEFSAPNNIIGFRAVSLACTDFYNEDGDFIERVYTLINLGKERTVNVNISEWVYDEELDEDVSTKVVDQTIQMDANQTLTFYSYEEDGYLDEEQRCSFTENRFPVTFHP